MNRYRDGLMGKKGRLETRRIGTVLAGVSNDTLIGGNGSRVALHFAAYFTGGPVAGADVAAGPLIDGANTNLVALTYGHSMATVTYDQIGDAIYSKWGIFVGAAVVGVSVWETVWQPEEV